jgi:hypothetical protein
MLPGSLHSEAAKCATAPVGMTAQEKAHRQESSRKKPRDGAEVAVPQVGAFRLSGMTIEERALPFGRLRVNEPGPYIAEGD